MSAATSSLETLEHSPSKRSENFVTLKSLSPSSLPFFLSLHSSTRLSFTSSIKSINSTQLPISALAPKTQELSTPSSRAGTAAHPVTELAKEEPRVVEGHLQGPYDGNGSRGGLEGVEERISKLSVAPTTSSTPSTSSPSAAEANFHGEQLEGIEPVGARKAANPPLTTSETPESKPVVDVAEEKLRTLADTAAGYLPSQETQQKALDATKDTLSATASAAVAGASYAGGAIASGAQAVVDAVQPHLPESLGGPHNAANDSTVKDDLDDLVTRAAEAKEPKSAETKAITTSPNVTTAGKEEATLNVSRFHPKPAIDTQQPPSTFSESLSEKKTLREPKIPFDATSPVAVALATAGTTSSGTAALAIDKSRAGTASAPPATPLREIPFETSSKPVSLPLPGEHPSRDLTARPDSPSPTAANFDPTETREKDPSYHSSPSIHHTLDFDKPSLKVIDHPQPNQQGGSSTVEEKEHK